ncbi:MAG: carbohydrate ABC transporter permease [Oscillospiraceae bacterium]|nr:carbohydrate ABC transporter permease [Oscillospiraceae bacterium]
MKTKKLFSGRLRYSLFDFVNVFIMLVIIVLTLYPFWYVVVGSFNDGTDYLLRPTVFWPSRFTLVNFQAVFRYKALPQAFLITVSRTALGTVLHIFVTSLFAYAISRPELIARKLYTTLGLITMFFGGGLIPYYLVIATLGLTNTFWVYIIPGVFSFWNAIIFRSFFSQLPDSLIEVSRIEGAGEYRIFFTIIMPLSTPVFAALSLFTAIGHWNSFFDSMLYTHDNNLQTAQLFLMKLIKSTQTAAQMAQELNTRPDQLETVTTLSVQLATMVTITTPILVLYPFLQRFFVKGLMIGSVKG